jgi:hypothetical protein
MRHIKEFSQLFESQQGLTQDQKDWLDLCTDDAWWVNPQTGLVDVEGVFDCEAQGLSDFKGVRFGRVKGYFSCACNRITSLEGAPQEVGGYFSCSYNRIASLEGAPQSVGVYFSCSYNQITSLEGAPQNVNEAFNCSHNRITSLEGAPQNVKETFNCSSNGLTSLKGGPQSVDEDFNCSGNQLTSLKEGPQSVGKDFNCSNNLLTSLEGAPQTVGGYLYCSGNPISEFSITNVIRRMSDRNVSLEQAVSFRWKTGEWDEIPEADKLYLAKHNPDLTPEERKEYAALERLKKRII